MPRSSGTFKPGHSGNPAGRVKGLERQIRDIVLSQRCQFGEEWHDGLYAIVMTLFKLAVGGDVPATKLLLERGWGMPKQQIDIDMVTTQVAAIDWSSVSVEKRRELLAALDAVGALPAVSSDESTEH